MNFNPWISEPKRQRTGKEPDEPATSARQLFPDTCARIRSISDSSEGSVDSVDGFVRRFINDNFDYCVDGAFYQLSVPVEALKMDALTIALHRGIENIVLSRLVQTLLFPEPEARSISSPAAAYRLMAFGVQNNMEHAKELLNTHRVRGFGVSRDPELKIQISRPDSSPVFICKNAHTFVNNAGSALVNVLRIDIALTRICIMGISLSPANYEELSSILIETTTLIELTVMKCTVGAHGASCLANGIKHNASLLTFCLDGLICFEQKGLIEILDAVKGNHTLINLYLRNLPNTIPRHTRASFMAYSAFESMLKENETLKYLTIVNLGDNFLVDAIGRALPLNASLINLRLNNMINIAYGICQLTQGLMHNSSVKRLDLRENELDKDSATALFNGLNINRTVQLVDLRKNPALKPLDPEKISAILTGNSSLEKVFWDHADEAILDITLIRATKAPQISLPSTSSGV